MKTINTPGYHSRISQKLKAVRDLPMRRTFLLAPCSILANYENRNGATTDMMSEKPHSKRPKWKFKCNDRSYPGIERTIQYLESMKGFYLGREPCRQLSNAVPYYVLLSGEYLVCTSPFWFIHYFPLFLSAASPLLKIGPAEHRYGQGVDIL